MLIYIGHYHNGNSDEHFWFGAYSDKQKLVKEMGEYILIKRGYIDEIEKFYNYIRFKDELCRDLGIDYDLFQAQQIKDGSDFIKSTIILDQLCCSQEAIEFALEDSQDEIHILPFKESPS
jgi:hypothetical protein